MSGPYTLYLFVIKCLMGDYRQGSRFVSLVIHLIKPKFIVCLQDVILIMRETIK